MRKVAYPWIDGHDQSSELSNNPIDDTTSPWYDTFSPSGGRSDIICDTDNHSLVEYSEGIISPVDELDELLISLGKNKRDSGVLVVEASLLARTLRNAGYNIVSFTRGSYEIDDEYIRKISGDIRFYNFDKKFDIILFNGNVIRSKIAYKNISNHLCAHAYLVDLAGKAYIKDSRKNTTIAKVELRNGDLLSFKCDVASDNRTKTIGLQSYSSLPNDSGLLFKYGSPIDVTFHMGTVGFPIDIIFADENGIILKISSSIKPGSLGLYACANVKSVLEIAGGSANELGIAVGDVIRDGGPDGLQEALISGRNPGGLISKKSTAGLTKLGAYREYFKKGRSQEQGVSIFSLDEQVFSDNSFLKVYSARPVSKEDLKIYRDVNNCTFASDLPPISISLSNFENSSILKSSRNRVSVGPNQSMDGVVIDKVSLKNINSELKNGKRVVIATKSNLDNKCFEFILHSKLASAFPGVSYESKLLIMNIPDNFDDYDIICAAKDKYLTNSAKFFDGRVVKVAGVPVSEQVKTKAKHARRFFVRAEENIEKISNDLNHNATEYEKFASDLDAVKSSKGEFNRSSKRVSKKVKSILVEIRDGIRILNSIKDVSSTIEMIDRLTVGAKEYSRHINDIFALINIISSPDFVTKHSENVSKADALGGDLSSSLIRAKNYIDSNILGITILSE
jgi:uncharacterized membrane protein (UPF0127 family)